MATPQESRKPERARTLGAEDARKRNDEVERVEQDSTPATPVIYEAVRRLGKEEMARPVVSLAWSGLAAGLSMSFSLLAQAILYMRLPDTEWRPLLSSLGYPVGFLMVVLTRQQLFTETTITVVLPIMKEPTRRHLLCGLRMWVVVLGANFVGTFFAALFIAHAPAVSEELREAMIDIARTAMSHGWVDMGFRGITAGFLMAALVWLLPGAGSSQFPVIMVVTYIIGAGEFAHIVAGSVEAFLLAVNGEMGLGALLGNFMAPVLVGNVIGGTVLFAVLSYAQVMKEL